jgi:hypothetical protein
MGDGVCVRSGGELSMSDVPPPPELSPIFDRLRSTEVSSVYVESFVEDDTGLGTGRVARAGTRRVAPRWWRVYLDLGQHLLVLSADPNDEGITLALRDRFSPAEEIEAPDELGLVDLGGLLLNLAGVPMRVSAFEALLGLPEHTRRGTFLAVGFTFRYGSGGTPVERYVFFDGCNAEGIAIGRREERQEWFASGVPCGRLRGQPPVSQVWRLLEPFP